MKHSKYFKNWLVILSYAILGGAVLFFVLSSILTLSTAIQDETTKEWSFNTTFITMDAVAIVLMCAGLIMITASTIAFLVLKRSRAKKAQELNSLGQKSQPKDGRFLQRIEHEKPAKFSDYFVLYFNVSTTTNIFVITVLTVALPTAIISGIVNMDVMTIILIVVTSLLFLIALFGLIFLPILHLARAKKAQTEVIEIFNDKLVISDDILREGKVTKVSQEFRLKNVTRVIKTKSAYILYQEKRGLIISKANELEPETIELFESL